VAIIIFMDIYCSKVAKYYLSMLFGQSFESSENSSDRKSSMLCLVSLHEKVGDDMLPLLSSLSQSKVRQPLNSPA